MCSIADLHPFIKVVFTVVFFKEQVISTETDEEYTTGDTDRFSVCDQIFKQTTEGICYHHPKNITKPYSSNKIKSTCKSIIYPQLNNGKNYRAN